MEHNYREDIGRQLELSRKAKRLSLRQLAELTGFKYSNICRIEQGRYNTGIDVIGKIADVLDCDVIITKRG